LRRAFITSSTPGSGGPVIRGGRDHMNLDFMIFHACLTRCYAFLAIWLGQSDPVNEFVKNAYIASARFR
jgi:hypothetical protein